MISPGNCFVKACESMQGVPARILCILFVLAQGGILDYYLIYYQGKDRFAWVAFDVSNAGIFIASFVISWKHLQLQKRGEEYKNAITIGWFAWLIYVVSLIARMIIVFHRFALHLEEEDFFGPTTLKTTIALASVVFVFLLLSHHDAPIGSDRRRYIEELTGTVIFDVLDTVDILEILLRSEAREVFPPGMEEAILATASLNLLLPTVPFVTLSLTNFGHKKMPKRLVALHKLLVAFAINGPNLIVRLILWHGFSLGISPFSLKNIIIISIVLYEFYEHKKEKAEETEYDLKSHDSKDDLPSIYNKSFAMQERI